MTATLWRRPARNPKSQIYSYTYFWNLTVEIWKAFEPSATALPLPWMLSCCVSVKLPPRKSCAPNSKRLLGWPTYLITYCQITFFLFFDLCKMNDHSQILWTSTVSDWLSTINLLITHHDQQFKLVSACVFPSGFRRILAPLSFCKCYHTICRVSSLMHDPAPSSR